MLDYVPGDTLNLSNTFVERPFWLKNGFENMIEELQKLRSSSMKNFDEEINSELNNLKKISDNELTHYTKNI